MNHLGRTAAGLCEFEKIGIRRNDQEPLGRSEFPNLLIRRGTRQTRFENVRGARKELSKTANQLRGEICVEKKLQRDLRSRPAWAA